MPKPDSPQEKWKTKEKQRKEVRKTSSYTKVQHGNSGSSNQAGNIIYDKLPVIQVKERDGLGQIRALCRILHVQSTNTPAIFGVSLSFFIHFTDTTNLSDYIKL